MVLLEAELNFDQRRDLQRGPGLIGVVRLDGNRLFLPALLAAGTESYFYLSFPTRGNGRLREDGRGAASRALGSYEFQGFVADVLNRKGVRDLVSLRNGAEIVRWFGQVDGWSPADGSRGLVTVRLRSE